MAMNYTLYYKKKKINRQKQIVLQSKEKNLSEVSSIFSDKKATKLYPNIFIFKYQQENVNSDEKNHIYHFNIMYT